MLSQQIQPLAALSERLNRLLESTSANRFVTHWQIKIMVGPEGHRSAQEINTLADGSPTHFLRILSYGLANLMTASTVARPTSRDTTIAKM